METDPYFWTQDNGAGGPIHFATTYKQLDMVHHIVRNVPSCVNQRDGKGYTPLHRAAYLAQYDGYLELFEYLLLEGADPTITTNDYDPYLDPGLKTPLQVAIQDDDVRDRLQFLIDKYADVPKKPRCHPDLGCWWTLYDYGLDVVQTWAHDYKPDYPESRRRQKALEEKRLFKEQRRKKRQELEAQIELEIAEAKGELKNITIKDGKTDNSVIDPSTMNNSPIAFLFPGQGLQSVGMLKSCQDIPKVKEMCEKAKEILGYDILDVYINGPKEKLDETVYAQPALYLSGLAAVEKLKLDDPSFDESKVSAVAGLSLGEYCALVFAKAISFEDGLKVVKVRAESMAAAAKVGDHGMLTVVGLKDEQLEEIVQNVKSEGKKDEVLEIANYLFPQGRVVSGDKSALARVEKKAQDEGALKVAYLAVSGAFHTSRMDSAAENLKNVLETIEISKPEIPIFMNVLGTRLALSEMNKESIVRMLTKQLVSPVLWEATLKNLVSEGKTKLYELGPNSQIKSMTKRVSLDVWKEFTNIDVAK